MRRASGFTLLEVLAAVGVLGLLYTVLAGIALQGLRAEGEGRRWLEAAQRADTRLLEIEAGLDEGIVPPLGREEDEDDDFRMLVEVSPFELPIEPPETQGRGPRQSFVRSLRGAGSSPLRRIDVVVGWTEGLTEREVQRTTFALDVQAVADLVEGLAAAAEAEDVPDRNEGEDES